MILFGRLHQQHVDDWFDAMERFYYGGYRAEIEMDVRSGWNRLVDCDKRNGHVLYAWRKTQFWIQKIHRYYGYSGRYRVEYFTKRARTLVSAMVYSITRELLDEYHKEKAQAEQQPQSPLL